MGLRFHGTYLKNSYGAIFEAHIQSNVVNIQAGKCVKRAKDLRTLTFHLKKNDNNKVMGVMIRTQ